MKLNKVVSAVLSLVLAASCFASAAYADEAAPVERISITYKVEPDEKYGTPTVLNPAEAMNPERDTEFILAEDLKTDSILGTDPFTQEIYIGEWQFSGWTIPAYVSLKRIESDPDEIFGEAFSELITEKKTQTICKSYFDAEMTGRWTFVPHEKLAIPTRIEASTALPLAGSYDALARFWPERENELNKVYATGLFPESLIRYMDENIKEIPLQNTSFASVELSRTERVRFLNAVKETYEALTVENENTMAAKAGIEMLLASAPEETGEAGQDTAFVAYCAEKAGLLEGMSRALVKTASIRELYDFLKNDACADIITVDGLLQIYRAEDGEVASGVTFNDYSVDFAHDEDWYDVAGRKNTVLPGDLIVFKDELENPVTVGVIDSVSGRNITYVLCVSNGTPAEYTLDEAGLQNLSRTGARAEIIGLRVCDASRITYEFLVNELGLPESSALGIMGNLYYESRFSTTVLGDGNTSFGICQWHNDRFLNLVIFCMKNNYNIASLEGQLRFLEYELTTYYSGLLNELSRCGISSSWAKEAAYRFCQVFEQPADFELTATLRGSVAGGALWDSYSELFLSPAVLENMKMAELADRQVAQQQSEYIFYTVKDGDTLASICRSFGFDYANHRREVTKLNNITNENMLYVGQILIFPSTMIKNGQ